MGTQLPEHGSNGSPLGPSAGASGDRARLLICDDVDDIRMLVRLAFESASDFEVVGEATNGDEGISAAVDLRPDVILLDVNMPVKGGLEALPELREAVPDAAIVIFSGFDEWGLKMGTQDHGADAYIEKGANVDEMLERVRSIVQVQRSADGRV